MKQVIFPDDPKAATYRTDVHGWVSRTGLFFPEHNNAETLARYNGATHVPCQDCGRATRKSYFLCSDCRAKKEKERYSMRKKIERDGSFPLYSLGCKKYFWSQDDIAEYWWESELESVADLQLVPCDPVSLSEVDKSWWDDDLSEDGELPQNFIEALEVLNRIARNSEVAYTPGDCRVELPG